MARHIVLTGCTRGLGRALVDELLRQQDVFISGCGRSVQLIEEMNQEVDAAHARYSAVDVSDYEKVEDWADEVITAQGAPDLVINNAALINDNAPLWEVPVEQFDALIDVNIKGVYYVCRAFLPAMIERGCGVIVNLSSGWGRSTSPDVAPYCASKFAIEGMTKALSQELPDGLAAIPLNPGVIDTDMLRSCFGTGAADCIKPADWAKKAAPMLLQLTPKDSGKSLSV